MKNVRLFQQKNTWIVLLLGILLPAISFFLGKLNWVFGNNGSLLGKISYVTALFFTMTVLSEFKNNKNYANIVRLFIVHYLAIFFVTIVAPQLTVLFFKLPADSEIQNNMIRHGYHFLKYPKLWPLACVVGWLIALVTIGWLVIVTWKQVKIWPLLVGPYIFIVLWGLINHSSNAYSIIALNANALYKNTKMYALLPN